MKKNRKICLISLGSYPLFNTTIEITFGGAEVQLYQIGKELSKEYEVSFLVGNYNQNKKEVFENILVYRSISSDNSNNSFKMIIKAISLFIDLISVNADVYIQRSASMGTGLVAFYCKIFRKHFIYMSAHEIDCNGEYRKENGKLKGFFYEYGIKNAYKVISQYKDQQYMLKKYYSINSTPIPSVYNIPNISDFSINNREYVLWVGRGEKWKQPEVFIDLAIKFPEIKFIMIIPPSQDQDYTDILKEEFRMKPKNLEVIGFVPFKEIDNYFKKAIVFINTSYYEGFPNTFIQSALNGVPILSLSVDPDGILNKYNIGKNCNGDNSILSKELKTILDDKSHYVELCKNSYYYAKRKHDIKKNIRLLKKIL